MLTKSGDYTYVHTVFTAPGRVKVTRGGEVEQYRVARVWVLEDKSVVLVVPGSGSGKVDRLSLGLADSVNRTSKRTLEVLTEDGATIGLTESDCGCGLGYVASAGPVLGKWRITRVRRPEWFPA